MSLNSRRFLWLVCILICFSGCAEGPLWRTGYLSPWIRQQWSDEEQIAATLFTKRQKMRDIVENAIASGPDSREDASQYLSDIVNNDPILLMRIEATRLLGQLPTDTAGNALQIASRDREVEVRQAAVRSWETRRDDTAKQQLVKMARSDTEVDVRIAATSALGSFYGPVVTRTLSEVIQDPNPAMQLRAAEALVLVTGQDFGTDIQAWQQYLKRTVTDNPENTSGTAENQTDSSFR